MTGDTLHLSHPLRVRGLKYNAPKGKRARQISRTLYGCVDWNCWWSVSIFTQVVSHPLRVRGLKSIPIENPANFIKSHPLRVRGLKSECFCSRFISHKWSHPLRVRGLKFKYSDVKCHYSSRTLYGCVDWNEVSNMRAQLDQSRTLYGCVDWNLYQYRMIRPG